MAKTASKKASSAKGSKKSSPFKAVKGFIQVQRARWKEFRKDKVKLHKSFRRSYREDYIRKTQTPGLLSHAMTTFQFIFKHWRTFIPFILLMAVMYVVLVGLLSEDLYQQFQASIDESSSELASGQIGNFAKAEIGRAHV